MCKVIFKQKGNIYRLWEEKQQEYRRDRKSIVDLTFFHFTTSVVICA